MNVLQFLDDSEARSALEEFARVLRDRGNLILHVKNLSSVYFLTLWLAKTVKRYLGGYTKFEYIRPFRWYVRELTAAGFHITRYNSSNLFMLDGMPRAFISMLRKLESIYEAWLRRRPSFQRHGADLRLKAAIIKGSS